MNSNQFSLISKDLQTLAKIIPLNWGHVQNDSTDSQINMFEINSFEELEFKRKIVSKETEFLQSYKIDCVLLEQKIAKIGSILIDGEFEF
jgi:hypothetical protein